MDILGRRQETQQWLRCDSRNELGMESRDMLVDIIDMVSKSHQCSSTYAFASIPYDIKKALKCGTSAMNGYLHPPPQHLRCALSEIKSDPTLSRTPPLQAYLQQIQKSTKHYHHPGHENDKLYASDYIHQDDNKACDSCDSEQQLPRTPRKSTDPVIQYGTIASGNQVIKDAEQRDKLARQYDILCFEIEAAGIVNTIPSLVIRGICDYADSLKNKIWQRYAAATAAALAKFLLSRVRTHQDSGMNS